MCFNESMAGCGLTVKSRSGLLEINSANLFNLKTNVFAMLLTDQ
jgi:hypothetical protein